jgi:hypothetical protein
MAAQRKTQRDGAMVYLHARIESGTLQRFREVAEADHRTVSQELRRLVDQRIAEAVRDRASWDEAA